MDMWRTSWGYRTLDFRLFQTLAGDETQRVMLKNNLNGERVRLHFSNRYGVEAMTLGRVTLAPTRDMITSECGRAVPVTFDGREILTLAPGEETVSDEIAFPARAGEALAISAYLKNRCLITSGASSYPQPISRVYNSLPGDYTDRPYFPTQAQSAYFRPVKDEPEVSLIYGLDRVDVWCAEKARTMVCFGDSITHQSRFTGPLADRVYRAYPGGISLVNCGIGGNRILHDAYPLSGYGELFGEAGVKRFEQDVFGGGNPVDLVLVLEGVNDLLHPEAHYAPESERVTAREMIKGLKTFARVSHAHGAPAAIATLTPYRDFMGCWDQRAEAKRLTVNDWIRSGEDYDAFLDFDAIARDPERPDRLRPLVDSGDHIHPGQAGGIEIAYGFDLAPLAALMGR